ncbi:hypothetical protein KJ359_000386 [Pestalotiopsis sp. 9143b]|nr:hypothetical protein KJ359_000386 [Pestalotiopsis sp. 9143b]
MKLLFDFLLLAILALVATAAPILSQPPASSLEVVARGVAWAESSDAPKQTWREARDIEADSGASVESTDSPKGNWRQARSAASVESVDLPHGTWKEARDAEVAVGRAESSDSSDTPHSNWREAREEEDEDVLQAGDEDGEAPADDEDDLWSETETHQNDDSDPWDRDTFIADPTS